MNNIGIWFSHLINPTLPKQTEEIFEGIARGRSKALNNWFYEKWTNLELVSKSIESHMLFEQTNSSIYNLLNEKNKQFADFSELAIVNSHGDIIESSYRNHKGKKINREIADFIRKKGNIAQYMYGPYRDADTLLVGPTSSDFHDEVTLMFIQRVDNYLEDESVYLCGRMPNDAMSDILQDEDSHIYKESGDNYLFMIKNSRGIGQGTAISRSRFEDNAFTLGDNLKDGIPTKGFGTVIVNKYTEFEIVFNDPATNKLHKGVQNTIDYGSSLDAWPGYPEYRHILVGGKGVKINPPHTDEQWGLLCEGDIEEIYKYRSLNVKFAIPLAASNFIGVLLASILPINNIFLKILSSFGIGALLLIIGLSIINVMALRPIGNMIVLMKDIAEGEGDLTNRLDTAKSDQTGELARWFNKFINNQMNIIGRIIKVTIISTDSAENLKHLTSDIKDSSDNIDIRVTELTDTILEHSDKIKDLFDTISIQTEDTTRSMNNLKNYSDEINQIITIINGISRKINILSLNASIESARAGEHGVGFAVIAKEISNLSEQTVESTKNIEEFISNIQNEVSINSGYIAAIGQNVNEGNKNVIEEFRKVSTLKQEQCIQVLRSLEMNIAKMQEVKDIISNSSEMLHSTVNEFKIN